MHRLCFSFNLQYHHKCMCVYVAKQCTFQWSEMGHAPFEDPANTAHVSAVIAMNEF